MAASHSSSSNRLAGTSIALLVSSIRWLARPTRCRRRETPFGAPTWITWSTPPQSMPRSSEDVATTARSRPSAIAASTRRRCSRSRLPWWIAIGSVSALIRHSAWNSSSPCARVLTNTIVMPAALIRSRIRDAAVSPIRPDQGSRSSGSMTETAGGAASATSISSAPPPTQSSSARLCATVADSPTRRSPGANVPSRAMHSAS